MQASSSLTGHATGRMRLHASRIGGSNPIGWVAMRVCRSTPAVLSSCSYSWQQEQQQRGTSTSSVASASAELAPCPEAQRQADDASGVLQLVRVTRSLLCLLAGACAWTYIVSGTGGGGLFASMSMALPGAGLAGSELAIKSAWSGLATGVFHTLCGPDHLAGLAPLSIGRGRLAACGLGALWGFGHSTGQLILGLVFCALKDKFHDLMPALDTWASYIVPMTLIAIGILGIWESYFAKGGEAHAAPAGTKVAGAGAMSLAMGGAGGGSASVPFSPPASTSSSSSAESGKRAGMATYLTGIVHGLQPDALYVIVPALALPTKLSALLFVGMFVLGTVASMGAYTLAIGAGSGALIKKQPWLQAHLSTAACGFAILCGILMLLAGQGVPVPIFS